METGAAVVFRNHHTFHHTVLTSRGPTLNRKSIIKGCSEVLCILDTFRSVVLVLVFWIVVLLADVLADVPQAGRHEA